MPAVDLRFPGGRPDVFLAVAPALDSTEGHSKKGG
jgi:hypothetical protein